MEWRSSRRGTSGVRSVAPEESEVEGYTGNVYVKGDGPYKNGIEGTEPLTTERKSDVVYH